MVLNHLAFACLEHAVGIERQIVLYFAALHHIKMLLSRNRRVQNLCRTPRPGVKSKLSEWLTDPGRSPTTENDALPPLPESSISVAWKCLLVISNTAGSVTLRTSATSVFSDPRLAPISLVLKERPGRVSHSFNFQKSMSRFLSSSRPRAIRDFTVPRFAFKAFATSS